MGDLDRMRNVDKGKDAYRRAQNLERRLRDSNNGDIPLKDRAEVKRAYKEAHTYFNADDIFD